MAVGEARTGGGGGGRAKKIVPRVAGGCTTPSYKILTPDRYDNT